MDPFEARLQFIQILELLNPSQAVIVKAVQFCVKNQELHEDFHSCILEILDRLDLNAKVNVLYFLESLVATILGNTGSNDLDEKPYVRNIKKDFKLILEKVLPDDNLINLRNSVDTLVNMEKLYQLRNEEQFNKYMSLELNQDSSKSGLMEKEIDKSEKETDDQSKDVDLKDDKNDKNNTNNDRKDNEFIDSWKFLINRKLISLKNREKQLVNEEDYKDPEVIFTREQMLSRMETDRERHKRFKETSWIVNRNIPNNSTNKNGIDLLEFDKIWNKFDVINKDDLRELKELNDIAKESYQI